MEQKKTIWFIGPRTAWDTVEVGPFDTKEAAVNYALAEPVWKALYSGCTDFPEKIIGKRVIITEVPDGTP